MYKNANRYMQFSAGKMSLDALIEYGIDELSIDQQKANLVARNDYLKELIKTQPKSKKIVIGQEIFQIQQKLIELKQRRKKVESKKIENHFIDVCKERFTKFQFDLIMNEAYKRAASEEDKND